MPRYFLETRYYKRRSVNFIWIENEWERIPKREIREEVYKVLMNHILKGIKPIKNSDGSISYERLINSNEYIEDIITVEEAYE